MPPRSHAIESEVLSLPVRERAKLVVKLLDSIDDRGSADPQRVQKAWLEEANRRYEAYLLGEEEAISVEQAFAELRADDH